ncbi:MAG: vanadium-dependent haloperoxidase [Acidobacteria bacterium]|nr:vanadium-dependent haloperoxidase [Acidobacteriota bacterium]
MTRLQRRLTELAVCICLGWAIPAHADAVTHWNAITVRAVSTGRPGAVGFLDVALVHAAIHDAVQAFDNRFEPYRATITDATGSPAAAVAAAAYGVLAGIYPSQQGALEADYLAYLTANGLVGDPGLAAGQQAAAALLAEHRAAPNPPLPPYTGGTAPGVWRPTPSYIGDPPAPPPYSPMALLYMAFTKPFTLNRTSQFRPEPPPPLTSERYRRDYDEVKAYGARFGSARTAEQTDMAYFWNDNVVTQWNAVLRSIAGTYVTSLGDSARLFALANLATSDALISCWDTKYHYSFWRPITAIQEGDTDGNAKTVGDFLWQPLVNTPNYPEYSSGANNVSGAMTTTLQRFFGTDDLAFAVTSNAPMVQQRTRAYTRISDAAQEVVEARMLLGFHFRFADEEARRQGSRVADWVFRRTLGPVPGGGR